MEKLVADFKKIMALLNNSEYANIIPRDELESQLEMKKKEIIAEYEQNHKIWQGTDGRWRTQLPDENASSGRRQIAKSTREKVEKAVLEWYTEKREKETLQTMRGLYEKWIDYKAKETSDGNAYKLEWVWNHYYSNEPIADRKLKDIKVSELKEFMLDMIAKHKLTNRKYKEMKSSINMIYDYAIENEIVQTNTARNVRGISYKKFAKEEKKSIEQQVYIGDEKQQIIELALEQYKKTKNTAYLGVCLNFTLALRIGELVALHTDDLTDDTITISKQEIKTYEKVNEKRHRNGYEIVNYVKSQTSERELFLTSLAQDFIQMIIEANEQRGFKKGYLFLDSDGERMHDYAISNVLRRLNGKIKTAQKSNHKIRKTCLSGMANSNELTNEEIRDFAGHKDFKTTATYYLFPTKTKKQRQSAYEKAIIGDLKCNHKNIKSVTNCNQKNQALKKAGSL